MATSIITTTTFTVATMFEYRPQVNAAAEPANDESKIAACTFAALPRCAWSARNHCGPTSSCQS